MRRTVDRELARARTAARAVDARADPALVADSPIEVLRRTPDGVELEWRQNIQHGLSVSLHESDLAEALGALMENAARHAQHRIVVAAQNDGDCLHISIRDDGPGITEAKRADLLRRHARADEAGIGLGLAIASHIAEAASGRLVLGPEGPGLTATLAFPRR